MITVLAIPALVGLTTTPRLKASRTKPPGSSLAVADLSAGASASPNLAPAKKCRDAA
jgi:hypothetical protein